LQRAVGKGAVVPLTTTPADGAWRVRVRARSATAVPEASLERQSSRPTCPGLRAHGRRCPRRRVGPQRVLLPRRPWQNRGVARRRARRGAGCGVPHRSAARGRQGDAASRPRPKLPRIRERQAPPLDAPTAGRVQARRAPKPRRLRR
jgi:hypothetical protein